jgi:hypothetical protein
VPRRSGLITEARRQQILREEIGCLVRGCRGTPIHLHHVRTAANSGVGKKPSDRWLAPLCYEHHSIGHLIGWLTFEQTYRLDLVDEAKKLARIDREMP